MAAFRLALTAPESSFSSSKTALMLGSTVPLLADVWAAAVTLEIEVIAVLTVDVFTNSRSGWLKTVS